MHHYTTPEQRLIPPHTAQPTLSLVFSSEEREIKLSRAEEEEKEEEEEEEEDPALEKQEGGRMRDGLSFATLSRNRRQEQTL